MHHFHWNHNGSKHGPIPTLIGPFLVISTNPTPFIAGWWFGTPFFFSYIGNDNTNWLIFFQRGGSTTNQIVMDNPWKTSWSELTRNNSQPWPFHCSPQDSWMCFLTSITFGFYDTDNYTHYYSIHGIYEATSMCGTWGPHELHALQRVNPQISVMKKSRHEPLPQEQREYVMKSIELQTVRGQRHVF